MTPLSVGIPHHVTHTHTKDMKEEQRGLGMSLHWSPLSRSGMCRHTQDSHFLVSGDTFTLPVTYRGSHYVRTAIVKDPVCSSQKIKQSYVIQAYADNNFII